MNFKTLTYNERRIVETLRVTGLLTRAKLARVMSLSPATITRLTSNLLELGLLIERDDPSDVVKMGYPSKLLDIKPSGLYTIGVFFDPDNLYIGLCDLAGNLISDVKLEIKDRSFENIFTLAGEEVVKMVDASSVDRDNILGVGVSYPGHFTPDRSRVFRIKQFANWPDINVNTDFAPYFDYPIIHMNDSNASLLAELYYGSCRSFNSCCLVRFSYGIGGASIINQRLYVGSNKNSAEFGGLFPKSMPRPSGQNLIDMLRENDHIIERLSDVNETHLALPEVKEWMQNSLEQVRWLCLVIARTFDPEAIVFAGTIPQHIIEYFAKEIGDDDVLGEDFNVTCPQIILATKNKHPQMGAAALPINAYFNPDNYLGRTTKGR